MPGDLVVCWLGFWVAARSINELFLFSSSINFYVVYLTTKHDPKLSLTLSASAVLSSKYRFNPTHPSGGQHRAELQLGELRQPSFKQTV